MKAPAATHALLAFLVCILAAVNISAATLVVTKTADTNDGVCDADCSLREAIAAAAANDTVAFSALFDSLQTITLKLGQIPIIRDLTISGTGRDLLTISGNDASRIFRVTGGSIVSMSGMKLTNGLASTVGDAVGGGIYQTGGSLTLANMSITNNTAHQTGPTEFGAGGGILVDTGTLTFMNSTLSLNTVPIVAGAAGGGIYAVGSDIQVNSSTIDANSGQGIYGSENVSGSTSITIINSSVINNTGSAVQSISGPTTITNSNIRNNGGGIGMESSGCTLHVDRSVVHDNAAVGVANRGTATITNSTIRDNNNDQFGRVGGGIFNTGTMYVLNSSIANNTAFESGGGVFNALGYFYLTNSTISENFVSTGTGQSPCQGGGIYNLWNKTNPGGTVVLTNSTVTANRAQGRGGGICNDTGGIVITRNSIIAGNFGSPGPDVYGAVSSEGNDLIGNTAGSSGWIASDLQNIEALLAPLGNNGGYTWTHAVLPNSPAINAGNNALARDPYDNSPLMHDQRGAGFPRVVSGTVDIGSYEANYAAGPVTVSGRVLVLPGGRGVSNAKITFTDGLGNVRYTQTNPFGYYRFLELVPGTTYTITVSHKSYLFASPQVVTIDQPRDNLDFVALGH